MFRDRLLGFRSRDSTTMYPWASTMIPSPRRLFLGRQGIQIQVKEECHRHTRRVSCKDNVPFSSRLHDPEIEGAGVIRVDLAREIRLCFRSAHPRAAMLLSLPATPHFPNSSSSVFRIVKLFGCSCLRCQAAPCPLPYSSARRPLPELQRAAPRSGGAFFERAPGYDL